MKQYLVLLIMLGFVSFTECKAGDPVKDESKAIAAGNVVALSDAGFKKLIFNYDVNKDWKFEGSRPALIDFYADWCAPCRQLSPVVEEVAREYSGKIDVYKVDTEKERDLARKLGITALPTLLFVPAKGKPQISMGALPKGDLVKAINEILLIN